MNPSAWIHGTGQDLPSKVSLRFLQESGNHYRWVTNPLCRRWGIHLFVLVTVGQRDTDSCKPHHLVLPVGIGCQMMYFPYNGGMTRISPVPPLTVRKVWIGAMIKGWPYASRHQESPLIPGLTGHSLTVGLFPNPGKERREIGQVCNPWALAKRIAAHGITNE